MTKEKKEPACRHPKDQQIVVAFPSAVDGNKKDLTFKLTKCAKCGGNRQWEEI